METEKRAHTDGLILLASAIVFIGCGAYFAITSTSAAKAQVDASHRDAEAIASFEARYSGLSADEFRIQAQRFLASYDELIATVSSSTFEAGMFTPVPVHGSNTLVVPSRPDFPQELLLRHTIVHETTSVVYVLALDEARFPDVWEACREAQWLRARLRVDAE